MQQNYIRADTLTQANATLVDTQSTIALAQAWVDRVIFGAGNGQEPAIQYPFRGSGSP